MNRLYRAKREDNGKWVEGYYLCLNPNLKGELHIIVDVRGEYHRIDADTLGQNTGMLDKLGRLIYEGDMLNREGSIKQQGYVVKYDEREASWYAEADDDSIYLCEVHWEIIGNVHEIYEDD